MNSKISRIIIFSFLLVFSTGLYAQTTISGTIYDSGNGEPLIGVNILVKGTVLGTTTDVNGNFNLRVSSDPPFILSISSIGYERKEVEITQSNVSGLEVELQESLLLGQEVVVSASRVEESILESPVSIEKMDILDVQSTSADTYYKAIANLKGVDVTTSSINFQIINARGFSNTGNTRFVQLIDGMDTQAPALNFPIGNLNGPSELDVESVELIPGASSALYGPAAFNGVLLINSKNAFDYQGLSAFVKMGVNHVGQNADRDISPMYEGSIRYAKAFNNKFAFKVNGSYSRANDWHGTSTFDRNAALTPEGFGDYNPAADRLHFHGDEAGINLAIFPFSDGFNAVARGVNFGNGFTANDYSQSGMLPNHVVNVSPYEEVDLIDYGAENIKANVGLYYRLNDKNELSYLYNAGFGTSIYTGAQRYSLANFGIQQHRIQLRGDNYYLRAYGTFENSGDSYITELLAKRVNDITVGNVNPFWFNGGRGDLTGYLVDYGVEYLRSLASQGLNPGDPVNTDQSLAAHQFARGVVDGRYIVDPENGTITDLETGQPINFEDIKDRAGVGVVPVGPSFADRSAMYHAEGQYDFKNEIDWMNLQVGASFRLFDLGSDGTIFPDTAGNEITIAEYGIYAQASKNVTDNFKLSGSLRFDKNQNFDGQINPRISGVYTIAKNHNIRASYQTGFRFPTTQGQYIDLSVISNRLLGGLPEFYEAYDLPRRSSSGQFLSFTRASVNDFRDAIFAGQSPDAAAANLVEYTEAKPVMPEQVRSIEFGYKSLINNRLMIDAVYYYNIYNDFITQIQVVTAEENPDGTPNVLTILNGSDQNTFQIYTNLDDRVTAQGFAFGLDYSFDGGYTLGGNYNWNRLVGGFDEGILNDFNTPEHKFNINFGNRKLTDRLGFNVTYRWQEAFRWESSFAIGPVPAYGTLDAQLSYKLPDIKSIIKVGGSNVLNDYYIQSLGGPNIGAIYYVSITFDELMK